MRTGSLVSVKIEPLLIGTVVSIQCDIVEVRLQSGSSIIAHKSFFNFLSNNLSILK